MVEVEKILKEKVYQGKKITIEDICKACNISRSTFYHKYKSLDVFIEYYLIEQINEYFKYDRKLSMAKATYDFMSVIKEKKSIIQFLYDQTTCFEHNQIKKKLVLEFKDVVYFYSSQKYGMSEENLNRVSEGLYNQIHAWILHDCSDEITKVLGFCKEYFAIVCGHRCNFRLDE